ncbi:RNA-directed DNA polymerase, eukaryota, nucleotide-binding alpha-beta plait domain protein [Tanacetum coccineum]|uniref:RNA-directed DNA polymerase, eukaryota, nucleotide-binding alpha-beta plait domain protein n=1 Tax=Tanacetum coccineum TaxID=301880 RepID=A0ABQ5FBG9_9ASTR
MGDHNRLSFRSNEDLTQKVSHSIYVTNFPDSVNSRDLWRECSAYGTVVDVFIPIKKSKAGKRFAFVRFIKVFNLDRLVQNLCTLWIGRYHLYANKVRFDRPTKAPVRNSNFPPLNGSARVPSHNYVHANVNHNNGRAVSYAKAINGATLKKFSSINNLRVLLANEGFSNVKVTYLGGLWVMLDLESSISKKKLMEHVGVASWFTSLSNAQADFISRDRIVWIDIEGVPLHVWSRNTFTKIGSKSGEVMDLEESNDDMFARK